MRPRKLLASRALVTLEVKVAAGIPLAAAMRQMNINMSRPAVAKLLAWLAKADDPMDDLYHLNLRLNLFPEWLDATSTEPQEQPDTWIFEGHFPTRGQWVAK
tara:strand:+ start:3889 stop:4194 length:306 start_codon:yes stop_codon:yes gene_type:complete